MEMILSINNGKLVSSTEYQSISIESQLLNDLKSYNKEYQEIKQNSDNAKLLALGKKLFKTFSKILSLEEWLNDPSIKKLEIVSAVSPTELEVLLLSLPWEILATEEGYLAEDERLFEVVRRIGGSANEHTNRVKYSDITLAFMAADPNFESGLQYEVEERVILDASQRHKNLNLIVEESGNLVSLENRLFELGHCDMVHLTAHGGFDGDDFILMLEDDRFNVEVARAENFRQLSSNLQAIFLSACHSAEFKNNKNMAMSMASIGMANVMGWDGAVSDNNATQFTAYFYKYLQLGSSLSYACAFTRNSLLKKKINDWHLMRVYLNANGGEGLNIRGGKRSPKKRYQKMHKVIDAQKGGITVATKETFVGRRRETKEAHHAFDNEKSVLLYGLGGTGKSSLAVRIVERLNPPYKAVFMYKDYDYISLITSLEKEISKNYNDLNFPELINEIRVNPRRLYFELVNILENYLDDYPIILVIDDLEQYVLEPLMQNEVDVMVKKDYQLFFQNVIDAFKDADTKSRLLFTSRYKFKLTNNSDTPIHNINVPDMTRSEQIKHWLAVSYKDATNLTNEEKYLNRILKISKGNPGLQDVLFNPLNKKEFKTLELALDKLESYNINALVESESIGVKDVDKYLQRIALEVYHNALTKTELFLLRVLTMFNFPIPQTLITLSAEELGIDNPEKALNRLDNFGLLNHLQGEGVENHISCYGLVHNIVKPLSREDRNAIAKITVHHLLHIWFVDFLEKYPVSKSDDFALEIEEIFNKYFPRNYKGEEPLQTLLEQQRIGYIHEFCLSNTLIDWNALNFDHIEFIPKLELSLSLNIFEKLRVSSNALKDLSLFQMSELYKVFIEEREAFKNLAKEHPSDILRLILKNFSFRPDLINFAYSLYFQHYSELELEMIRNIDRDDKEGQYKIMIKLAKNNQELANNLGNYAVFLKNDLKDYPKAQEMYERAIKADPKHANNLGNYAKLLFVISNHNKAVKLLEKAESIKELHSDLAIELAFYRYAHVSPYALKPLKELLLNGARSIDWDLNDNVEKAIEEKHPHSDMIATIANVISGKEDIATLDKFLKWNEE